MTFNGSSVPKLTVITLSRDFENQTETTMRSVWGQTVLPDRHLVVDSSTLRVAGKIKELCRGVGAEYLWTSPNGIYPAMRVAVSKLDLDGYCIFLNSGDCFAAQDTLAKVQHALINRGDPRPVWAIGGLLFSSPDNRAIPPYSIDASPEDFGSRLRQGRFWLPHPATVYRSSALVKVRPFEDRLRLAADYATGLRMFQSFGPPLLLRDPIAVFDTAGISSAHPIRGAFENSLARLGAFGPLVLPREIYILVRFVSKRILTRIFE